MAAIGPQEMQILTALRRNTSGSVATRGDILRTANMLSPSGRPDPKTVQAVLSAYQKFIGQNGSKAFSQLGGKAGGGKEQGPNPDAPAVSHSPHELNATAQPASQSPGAIGGSDAPSAALGGAQSTDNQQDNATQPKYDSQRQAQESRAAEEAGGKATNARLDRDATAFDASSTISSEDTGNITGSDVHRKQGGQVHIVHGQRGGVYEVTQDGNKRRISKKELADRQMFDVKHHSMTDPDNPDSPDPAARYGFAHHHEMDKLGLGSLDPSEVVGGVKGLHPADRPGAEQGEDAEEGADGDNPGDGNAKFNAHNIGKQNIPDGDMDDKENLKVSDIIEHLKNISQFYAVGGGLGHRLSWISDGEKQSTTGKDGTTVRSTGKGTLNYFDFEVVQNKDGSITVTPKVVKHNLAKNSMTAEAKAQMIGSGATHPSKMGRPESSQDSLQYPPLTITAEDLEAGHIAQLNQMVSHLANFAHMQRTGDVNKAMEDHAQLNGEYNDSHPRSQFSEFSKKSWKRSHRSILMRKGIPIMRKSMPTAAMTPEDKGFSDIANQPQGINWGARGRQNGWDGNALRNHGVDLLSGQYKPIGGAMYRAPAGNMLNPVVSRYGTIDPKESIQRNGGEHGAAMHHLGYTAGRELADHYRPEGDEANYPPAWQRNSPYFQDTINHLHSAISAQPHLAQHADRFAGAMNQGITDHLSAQKQGLQNSGGYMDSNQTITPGRPAPPPGSGPTLVRSWQDYRKLRKGDLDDGWQIGQRPDSPTEEQPPEYGSDSYDDWKNTQMRNNQRDDDAMDANNGRLRNHLNEPDEVHDQRAQHMANRAVSAGQNTLAVPLPHPDHIDPDGVNMNHIGRYIHALQGAGQSITGGGHYDSSTHSHILPFGPTGTPTQAAPQAPSATSPLGPDSPYRLPNTNQSQAPQGYNSVAGRVQSGDPPSLRRMPGVLSNPNPNAPARPTAPPTVGQPTKAPYMRSIKSWNDYQLAKGMWGTAYDLLSHAEVGLMEPHVRLQEGAEADHIPTTAEPRVHSAHTKLGTQTGAKPSDYTANPKTSFLDSINGGDAEQDNSLRGATAKKPSIAAQVLGMLLGGHPDDAGWQNLVESHNWQETTVPLAHLHGDNGTDYDKKKVGAMRRRMNSGNAMPPLIGLLHGPESVHIIDGKHRKRAMAANGEYATRVIVGTPKKKRR